MRPLRCTLIPVLLLAAGLAAAQDFPVQSPSLPGVPPAGIAAPAVPVPLAEELITPFQMLDRFILPGERQRLRWSLPDQLGRGELPSPVVVVHGAKPGPTLCLIAGIHGDEINGIEVVRRIAWEVDPRRLSGTLVAAPIVNVFGYTRISRYLPDRRDLNRHFPGSRHGSVASRVAHGFFTDIVRHCDALVDFHTGSFQRTNLPQIRADLTRPEVLDFTRNFGDILVLHSPGTRGMLRVAAVEAGIPAVTFEVGAPQFLEAEYIKPAAESLRVLMRRMGMVASRESQRIADGVQAAAPAPTYFDSRWLRANGTGFLFSEVRLGQHVELGERLGHIIDPVNNTRVEIVSPFPATVLGMAQDQQVLAGYAVFHLGKRTSEQQAVLEAQAADAEGSEEEDPDERAAIDDLRRTEEERE